MYYKITGILICLTINCAEKSLSLTSVNKSEVSEDVIKDLRKQLLETQTTLLHTRATHEKTKEKLQITLATIQALHMRSRAVTTRLLNRALAVPEYETEIQRENTLIDRSCSLCKKVLSKKNPEDNPSENHTRKVTMTMNCTHCFCVPCHTQWKASPHYQNNCAACNGPETSSSTFTIRYD